VLVGFRERHAPYLTDMHRCEVLAKPVDSLLDPLSELIGKLSIRKRLPQIEVAVADNAVALLFRVLDPPTDEDCAAFTAFAIEYDVRVLLQTGGLDSVAPLYPEPPLDPLCYRLPDFDLTISFDASDFVQINGRVNQRMVREAVSLLQIGEDDRVLDLYCGIGNFSLPMARNAQHVLGVEGEMKQVQRATDNARQNDIDNCEFRCADLSKVDGSESWLNAGWDRVLLDPARSGAAEIVGLMSRIGAARIVYVSCHPGTLARDAATLVQSGGYRLEAAGIIDMFAHTGHVESLAVFQKTTMP
jgi:23S rRNA (uracil1939-C5)-methyltransferase